MSTLLPRLSRSSARCSRYFRVADEVQQAICENRPVVALESTIYTHGFPAPHNLALASRLEALVRANAAVPATVAVLDGVARVGLGADELARLVATPPGPAGPAPRKVSRRDLPFVLGLRDVRGRRLNGATTVSGTMVLAHMAGIRILGTGGLGGVHRGAELTMDVSADLTELARTPVAVVSSGCKSFLDIPKTLEYLETQGVAVATFAHGRTGNIDFPAFYARDSGVRSPMVLRDEQDAARLILAQQSIGLQSGVHLANPIPEQHSLPLDTMEQAIKQALESALAAGATGNAATPYILAKIKDITGGESVKANTALVEANVSTAARVAAALHALERDMMASLTSAQPFLPLSPTMQGYKKQSQHSAAHLKTDLASTDQPADIFVAGSLAIDLSCDFHPRAESDLQSPEPCTSNPAQIAQSLGGVGHNVARAAHLMGADVRLCSAVADDLSGKAALEALALVEMSTAGIKTLSSSEGSRTAQYIAINDRHKDLVLAMADMSILESPSSKSTAIPSALEDFWLPQFHTSRPAHLALDANWAPKYLSRWLHAAKSISATVTFEPVSKTKAAAVFSLPDLQVYPDPSIHIATPNIHELASMHGAARSAHLFERQDWWNVVDALGIPHSGARTHMSLATSAEFVDRGIPQMAVQLLPFIPALLTTLGPQGVLLTQIIPAGDDRLTDAAYAPYILSRCRNETEGALGVGGLYLRLFPSVEDVPAHDVVSVNGVGDTFVGALLAGFAKRGAGARLEELVDVAQRAAVLTLKGRASVSAGLGTLRSSL